MSVQTKPTLSQSFHPRIDYIKLRESDHLLRQAGLLECCNTAPQGSMSDLALSALCAIRRGHVQSGTICPNLQRLLAGMIGISLEII